MSLSSPPRPSEAAPPTAPPPTVIDLSGVCVTFGNASVLRDVNLSVKRGEFVALIGPSGGGKSTLLRVIAGLLEANKGEVNVEGDSAVVFQDYRLLPWRTVRRNVALPRDLTGRGEAADAVLKQVGMADHAERYPHQLSGGMQARIAIARALAQDAEVLLMDEPFAALDALVRERFNAELKRLHNKTQKTVLFVTHSIREAVYLADRVVVLRDGRIETVLDARAEGRITAYEQGIEADLRAHLGVADSTELRRDRTPPRFPWEWFGTALLAGLFLLGWSALAARVSPLFLPSPLEVGRALLSNADLLWGHTLATLHVTLLGVLVALGIGVPLGYAMGRSKPLERLLSPFVVALQAVPTVIIAPLLVLWLDYGLTSKLTVTSLISVFPVLVSTITGVREVGRVYREVFRTVGATAWGQFTRLELPGALPVVLGGLRLTVTLALIGTVVGEFVFGGPGLGAFADSERLNFRMANAVAAVGVNVALGLALYGAVGLLEAWALRYRRR